jgi:hypothetical protein
MIEEDPCLKPERRPAVSSMAPQEGLATDSDLFQEQDGTCPPAANHPWHSNLGVVLVRVEVDDEAFVVQHGLFARALSESPDPLAAARSHAEDPAQVATAVRRAGGAEDVQRLGGPELGLVTSHTTDLHATGREAGLDVAAIHSLGTAGTPRPLQPAGVTKCAWQRQQSTREVVAWGTAVEDPHTQ